MSSFIDELRKFLKDNTGSASYNTQTGEYKEYPSSMEYINLMGNDRVARSVGDMLNVPRVESKYGTSDPYEITILDEGNIGPGRDNVDSWAYNPPRTEYGADGSYTFRIQPGDTRSEGEKVLDKYTGIPSIIRFFENMSKGNKRK